MTTPVWQAPLNGLPGAQRANLGSGHLNQLLGAHAATEIYEGVRIIAPSGGTQLTWAPMSSATDYDQPITMSGTSIGRVQLPLLPVGNGADVLVQLWPDNGSGSPNTAGNPIASALLPAAYTNAVAATIGLENATSPLQTQLDNEYGFTGSVATTPFPTPAGNATGAIANPTVCVTDDTLLLISGFDHAGATRLTTVASMTYQNGTLGQPVPQPSLPDTATYGGATVVNDATVVVVGGFNTGNTLVANVWAASWNPGSHSIGSWSAQNALPTALSVCATTSWKSSVYVLGGANSSNNAVSTVYGASVTNGQVGAWQTLSPLPAALSNVMAVACQGWLFVIGGLTTPGSGSPVPSVYYAKINADGSIGPWLTGPSIPNAESAFASGWNVFATSNAVVQISGHGDAGSPIQILSVTANGPASFWYISVWGAFGDLPFLPVSVGQGQWQVFSPLFAITPSILQTSTLTPMPYISVPLYASSLTNGATYHILLRAVASSSASDGMQVGTLDDTALPAIALQSPRYANTWTHIPSGWSVPLRVWGQSITGNLRHLWQDQVNGMAQQWSSVFYNGQKLLSGAAEVTMHPNVPLNSNPTFTSGVSPWAAVNGTVTRSSAQVHGGYAFSGLLTPTGGFLQAYAASELFPVRQTPYGNAAWLTPTGWFYTPTTWASFSLSVNWFDAGQNYISTSSATGSLTGATWTQVSNFFQPPATAAFGQLIPTMSGSPGATNTLYMSNVQMLLAPEQVGAMASIAQVNYPATAPWPPTGVTQLN